MIFLKLLLKNIGLILTIKTVFCVGNSLENIGRLPNNTMPVHYDISLTSYLEEGNFTFYGKSNVKFKICYASSKISLHSKELEINETATMLINDKDTIYKPMEHIYNNVTDILTLNFKNVLSPGLYILNMKFSGNLLPESMRRGFMKFPYTIDKGNDTKWLAATHFEPDGARRMFPCWDEPALKATFNISVKHRQKYGVLSNMPIREQFLEQDGMMQTHFDITPIMSTYTVAIVMSDFVRVPNANETINMWCKSSLTSKVKFAHSIAEKVVEFLIQYTNSSQKVPKMDHVLIPSFIIDGMENWGLIIYSESNIIYEESNPIDKEKQARIISHELAHQWFGNLVTPVWWTYLWLSEGLASFFEAYTINEIFKDWRAMDLFVIESLQHCWIRDTGLMNSVTLKLNNTLDEHLVFSSEVYKKAPTLLRMLHNTITAEVFRKGLIRYLSKHQFSTATPDDLWSAMQSALDESNIPHENYAIKEVMDTWMNQERYPLLRVERNYETGEVTISQTCIQLYGETENKTTKWWIPITFATQSNPDFSNTVPRYWLRPDQHNISFIINSDDWIIVNLQLSGYYSVFYDVTNWKKIIHYLKSREYRNIHVLNRAQIIIDSFAMVTNNQINGYLFVQLISNLAVDKNYVAWQPFFNIIESLQTSLSFPEIRNIKIRFDQLFSRLFEYVGYEEGLNDDHITKLTRSKALQWACLSGHEECKKMTALKLSEYLANNEIHKIPSFMFCTGMMAANRTTWDKMLKLYLKKELKGENYDKTLLWGLSCAEDPDIIINYLNTAKNALLFSKHEYSLILVYILKRHVSNDTILDYILKNFMVIKPILFTTSSIINLILENIYSIEQVDKVGTFSTNFNLTSDTSNTSNQDVIKERKLNLKISADIVKEWFSYTAEDII